MSRVLCVPTKGELMARKEIVVLSTTLGFTGFVAIAYPLDFIEALQLIEQAKVIHCHHGHQPTLDVVNKLTGKKLVANRTPYTPKDGDIALAIKLNKRLGKFGVEVKPHLCDLDFALVFYRKL